MEKQVFYNPENDERRPKTFYHLGGKCCLTCKYCEDVLTTEDGDYGICYLVTDFLSNNEEPRGQSVTLYGLCDFYERDTFDEEE